MKRLTFILSILLIGNSTIAQKTTSNAKSDNLNDGTYPKLSNNSDVIRTIGYKFSSDITDSEPGKGTFRYNNDKIYNVTYIFLDNIDMSGVDQTRWCSTLEDPTGATGREQLIISDDIGNKTVFYISGVFVKESRYWKIPVKFATGKMAISGKPYYYVYNNLKVKEKGDNAEKGKNVVPAKNGTEENKNTGLIAISEVTVASDAGKTSQVVEVTQEQKENEEKRVAQEQKEAEDKRIAQEQKENEDKKIAQEQKEAEDKRIAQEQKENEDKKIAQEQKEAEDKRIAQEQKENEDKKIAQEQKEAEDKRIAQEQKENEDKRIAQEQKEAEDKRITQEKKEAEDKRIAQEQKENEDKKIAQERKEAEDKRIAQEQKENDDKRIAQEQKETEDKRIAQEQKETDDKRIAQEQKETEDKRIAQEQKEADDKRIAQEQKETEDKRIAQEQKEADDKRIAQEQKEAEDKRVAQEQKENEDKKIAQQQKENQETKVDQKKKETRENPGIKSTQTKPTTQKQKVIDTDIVPVVNKQADVNQVVQNKPVIQTVMVTQGVHNNTTNTNQQTNVNQTTQNKPVTQTVTVTQGVHNNTTNTNQQTNVNQTTQNKPVTQTVTGNQGKQSTNTNQQRQETNVSTGKNTVTQNQSYQVNQNNRYSYTQNTTSLQNPTHSKCYRGIIEIGYDLGLGSYGISNFKFNFINGFKIGQYASVGLGVGYRHYNYRNANHSDKFLVSSVNQIPIFIDLRTSFSGKKLTPYIAAGLGGSTGTGSGLMQEGLYFTVSGGIWYNLSERLAVFAGLAYDHQRLEFSDTNPFTNNYNKYSNSLGINVGISF